MKYRIYTNEVAVETARQEKAAATENRLQVLRNRIARAHGRRLVLIAYVANARQDRTVANDARAKLVARGDLEKGFTLAEQLELVESRRESQSKMAKELQLA